MAVAAHGTGKVAVRVPAFLTRHGRSDADSYGDSSIEGGGYSTGGQL